jgi:hypothetical protein
MLSYTEKEVETMRRQLADAARMDVDFLEAGASDPVVILVHSSVAGARQWQRRRRAR